MIAGDAERNGLSWLKASYSTQFGQCVEIAATRGVVFVRHSKNPNGPILHYAVDEFETFLHSAQNGEFDHLIR